MRAQSQHAHELERGAFVQETREAIRGGFQRFYVEQLNEVAAQHGLPVYEIPQSWGHCQHEGTLQLWMRKVAGAVRAMDKMADPERAMKDPKPVPYGGPGEARQTGGNWAPILSRGGRGLAAKLHRMAAEGGVQLYNAITESGEPFEPAVAPEQERKDRPTDVRAAQAIRDSLEPQQEELAAPKPKTRRGARKR